MNKIALLYYPENYPDFIKNFLGKNIFEKLNYGMTSKRNPKDPEFMTTAFKQVFGEDYKLYHLQKPDECPKIDDQDDVVLIWPDCIGYNWNKLESKIFNKINKPYVRVFNGRRRTFLIPNNSFNVEYLGIKFRRFLEKFWVLEIMIIFIFTLLTPVFLLHDFIRGKN